MMDEADRALHAARVRAGQDRARAAGKRIGSPPRVSSVRLAECRALLLAGRTVNYVHRKTGVYRRGVQKLLDGLHDPQPVLHNPVAEDDEL